VVDIDAFHGTQEQVVAEGKDGLEVVAGGDIFNEGRIVRIGEADDPEGMAFGNRVEIVSDEGHGGGGAGGAGGCCGGRGGRILGSGPEVIHEDVGSRNGVDVPVVQLGMDDCIVDVIFGEDKVGV